jgi:hypothetical protein
MAAFKCHSLSWQQHEPGQKVAGSRRLRMTAGRQTPMRPPRGSRRSKVWAEIVVRERLGEFFVLVLVAVIFSNGGAETIRIDFSTRGSWVRLGTDPIAGAAYTFLNSCALRRRSRMLPHGRRLASRPSRRNANAYALAKSSCMSKRPEPPACPPRVLMTRAMALLSVFL